MFEICFQKRTNWNLPEVQLGPWIPGPDPSRRRCFSEEKSFEHHCIDVRSMQSGELMPWAKGLGRSPKSIPKRDHEGCPYCPARPMEQMQVTEEWPTLRLTPPHRLWPCCPLCQLCPRPLKRPLCVSGQWVGLSFRKELAKGFLFWYSPASSWWKSCKNSTKGDSLC